MFEFIEDLTPTTKGIIGVTGALGIATLISRHFDKTQHRALIAQADQMVQQPVVDPTNPYVVQQPQVVYQQVPQPQVVYQQAPQQPQQVVYQPAPQVAQQQPQPQVVVQQPPKG